MLPKYYIGKILPIYSISAIFPQKSHYASFPHGVFGELFKPFTDSASLLVDIEKNFVCFWFGVCWGERHKWESPLPGPGYQPIHPFFWLKFFRKLGQNPCL